MKKCSKCNGTGYIPKFYYIDNGKCFQCNGTGKEEIQGNTARLEALLEAFKRIEANYQQSKQTLVKAMNDFTNGLIDPFQLSDICGKLNFNEIEKEYNEWIKSIEDEKKLLTN